MKIGLFSNFFAACRYHAIHRDVYKWFDIKFDHFGRTSSPQQTDICQAIFNKLWENEWLSENTMQQVSCELNLILSWIVTSPFRL
jgi:methionyl-tRNA synthetase